ncbi:MarR family winged helix-turn-helix transcriptional regulator [Actinoallomurus iriomotensis]|uniref:MarR family transcriptional regulator n=1 Tax=Actinoallomurus iriomotensis TaxID=478107 RepID=A0A9W6VZV9_9ACTN|nr:MarR family transcriptional regulator [Actinoallomurus iriomotensis]GLY76428.1 MarR family transcriptional regulator [Actinoallomurus iriomotensis]GLY91628.1 MarR family transcriptional regulator [Actinoallomurus iriomotensis]
MTAPEDVIEIERALTRIAHLLTRARQHDRIVGEAGVAVDRASAPLLRALADAPGPVRMGALADRLAVEAPHVTRQVQRLQRAGFVERVPDPDDGRAQLVRITAEGADAVECLRAVIRRRMAEALADWSEEDRHDLAVLCHRMVDDFLRHAEERHLLGPRLG